MVPRASVDVSEFGRTLKNIWSFFSLSVLSTSISRTQFFLLQDKIVYLILIYCKNIKIYVNFEVRKKT